MNRTNRPHWVYRHYDADGVLLYVGMTVNPKRRPFERRERPWMVASMRVTLDGPFTQDEAAALERKVIREDHPLYNVYRNNGNVTATERVADSMTDADLASWDPLVLSILSDALSGIAS